MHGSNPNSFGSTLKRLRKKASLSIKSAAPKVDVNYTYLSKIENDHKIPSQDVLKKLCSLYDADAEDLIARLGELPPDVQEIVMEHGSEVFDLLRERYGNSRNQDKS